MTACAVYIDSELVTIEQATLSIEERVEERSTTSFTVIDSTASADYTRGMPVEVYDPDAAVNFAGFIDTPGRGRLSNQGGLLHDITCMDNHYLADKRLVVKSYTDKTAGYIARDILTSYLAAEGVIEGTIQAGPTIKSAIFNYVRASDCYEALKELTGFTWFISTDKKLYFIDRATNRAAWDLDNSTYRPLQDSVHLYKGNPLYRNKQYVRGGTGLTSSTHTETFEGDGVTTAFTVGYPIGLEPTVTVESRTPEAQTVGIKGLETGHDCYWNKGDATITFGVAPENAKTVTVIYYGQYPLIALAIDHAGILDRQTVEGGGSGIVEEIITEVQHDSADGIRESAAAKIKQYCQNAEKFTYQTNESGLSVGQIQAITYPLFGFSAHDMLIESIRITADGDFLLYDVSCITGPSVGSWAKFFANLLHRQDSTIKVGDSLLLVLLQHVESLTLVEATEIHEDDFSGGIVNRWIQLPPDESSGHNVQHEAIDLAELGDMFLRETGKYYWG